MLLIQYLQVSVQSVDIHDDCISFLINIEITFSPLCVKHRGLFVLRSAMLWLRQYIFKLLLKIICVFLAYSTKVYYLCIVIKNISPMSKKRKSKELKDKEDDLLFYLEYWNKFPSTFKKIAQKEIDQLEDDIKND
nr:MAG TPA: hypothetical protein [Caudoviricetes sp.]